MKLGSRLHTFVGYILNFHQATHKSLIQNESYRQSSEKTKNSCKHRKKIFTLVLLEFINLCFLSSCYRLT